jgi:hypothetical protein
MGQIFYACAYDTETRTCCTMNVDKFHANCHAESGAVLSIHYLLRQKPYRVMWGGNYVAINDNLDNFSRTEDLLGISTYSNYEDFEMCNSDLENKSYYGKAKFIGDNYDHWKRISVWDEAHDYFDWEKTHSVEYSGCLVNHTKKIAVDLADYHKRSRFFFGDGKYAPIGAIDAIPALTETGDGVKMALSEGVSTDSTEELAGRWCGDLLQIVDGLPQDYELINCCFADAWERAEYCYYAFGVSDDGFVLNDSDGKLFEASALTFWMKRGPTSYIKVERAEKKVKYIPVQTDGFMTDYTDSGIFEGR